MSLSRKPETVGVALTGYGYAGKTFHAPLIASTAGMSLSAVVSSNASKVEGDWPQTKVFGSLDELLNDTGTPIDLVVIATPNDTHFDMASRALQAGKHVVVDKPFTVTVREADDLIEIAAREKRLLSVFQNRRWDGDFLTLQKLIAGGRLGEIKHFESHFDRYRPVVRQRWRESAAPGGGLWHDLGPHLVDQALQLFGPPDTICGDLAIQRQAATAIDYFHVQLHYGSMRVILHAGSLVAAESARFTVHGSLGSFVKFGLDTQEEALKAGQRPDTSNNWGADGRHGVLTTYRGDTAVNETVETTAGDYPAYYRAIRDAITLGKPNPVPAEAAAAVMRIIEKVSGG